MSLLSRESATATSLSLQIGYNDDFFRSFSVVFGNSEEFLNGNRDECNDMTIIGSIGSTKKHGIGSIA